MSEKEDKFEKAIYTLSENLKNHFSGSKLANWVDLFLSAFYSSKNEDIVLQRYLSGLILPKWIRLFESKDQLKDERGKQLTIREHSYLLAQALYDVHQNSNVIGSTITHQGETIDWENASEWLEIASSVRYVDVLTGYFDDSLMMCRPAREYEDKRSDIVSQFSTQLAIFCLGQFRNEYQNN